MLGPAVACGARTSLDVGSAKDAGVLDREVPPDALPVRDAGLPDRGGDSPADVETEDVLPGIDASTPADASPCPLGTTFAYLLSQDARLYRFDPGTLATTLVGPLACPAGGQQPWTLTVSVSGRAYLVYTDWNLYEVDLTTLACVRTPYVAGQLGLVDDVGVTVAPAGGGEALYYVGATSAASSLVLGRSDLAMFALTEVGPVVPTPAELALDIRADAFGRIFGLGQQGTLVQNQSGLGGGARAGRHELPRVVVGAADVRLRALLLLRREREPVRSRDEAAHRARERRAHRRRGERGDVHPLSSATPTMPRLALSLAAFTSLSLACGAAPSGAAPATVPTVILSDDRPAARASGVHDDGGSPDPLVLDAPPADIPHVLDVNFKNRVHLVGYRFEPESAAPGQPVKLTLWWRCDDVLDEGWQVFTHTLDDGSGKMGNIDYDGPLRRPGDDHRQVLGPDRWSKGKVYVDVLSYTLPDDVTGATVTIPRGPLEG